MFYRLSNTSELLDIENELDAKFRFPKLYESKAFINGLEESNLPIIMASDTSKIDFAIWGLLPENYDDSWDTFQDMTNTLNTNVNDTQLSDDLYADALDKRRCLIVVNGFFTSNVKNGKLHPYHVHLKDFKPFCIAGIYNEINDGFLTCSLLVTKSSRAFDDIPHMGQLKPLIFKKKDYKAWLNATKSFSNLKSLIQDHDNYSFIAEPTNGMWHKPSPNLRNTLGDDFYRFNLKIS